MLGDAVRLAAVLAPQLPASPLADALAHLAHAVEGYRPAPSPGALDIPDPYPESAFSQTVPFDLGDVPVIVISGGLTADPIAALASALADHAQALAAAPRPDPTHLSYGMAMPIPLTTAQDAPAAGARARFGLGQIPLTAAPPQPPRPAHLLRAELDLTRENGWLVGGPGLSAVDGRLRSVQLSLTATGGPGSPGPAVRAVLDARLDQAAWRGVTVPAAGLADPRATPLIGAAFAAALAGSPDLTTGTGTTGTTGSGSAGTAAGSTGVTGSGLAAALAGIGLAATDAAGVTGLSADAFAALRADPVGYLGARIPAALAATGGWAGLIDAGGDGSYHFAPPGSPYGVFARPDGSGWRTGIETTTELDQPLWVAAAIDLSLPDFTLQADLAAHLAAITLRYGTAAGTVTLDADPFVHGLPLLPAPTPAQLGAQLGTALPDVLATGVLSAVLGQIVPGLDVGGLSELVHTPGQLLARVLGGSSGAGTGTTGGALDLTAVSGLLSTLNTAIGLPPGPGIQLPGGFSISAAAGTATPGSLALRLATGTPIEGVLGLAVALEIDPLLHVSPAGTLTLDVPLGGGIWDQLGITFGASGSGLSLVLTPQGNPPADPITHPSALQRPGTGPARRRRRAAAAAARRRPRRGRHPARRLGRPRPDRGRSPGPLRPGRRIPGPCPEFHRDAGRNLVRQRRHHRPHRAGPGRDRSAHPDPRAAGNPGRARSRADPLADGPPGRPGPARTVHRLGAERPGRGGGGHRAGAGRSARGAHRRGQRRPRRRGRQRLGRSGSQPARRRRGAAVQPGHRQRRPPPGPAAAAVHRHRGRPAGDQPGAVRRGHPGPRHGRGGDHRLGAAASRAGRAGRR